MLRINRYLILLFLCIGCRINEKKKFRIEQSDCLLWKKDTFGCLKLREEVIDKHFLEIEEFKGNSSELFISFFGIPNGVKRFDNGFYLMYHIDCMFAPPIIGLGQEFQKNRINNDSGQLIVEVGNNNLIYEIRIIQP